MHSPYLIVSQPLTLSWANWVYLTFNFPTMELNAIFNDQHFRVQSWLPLTRKFPLTLKMTITSYSTTTTKFLKCGHVMYVPWNCHGTHHMGVACSSGNTGKLPRLLVQSPHAHGVVLWPGHQSVPVRADIQWQDHAPMSIEQLASGGGAMEDFYLLTVIGYHQEFFLLTRKPHVYHFIKITNQLKESKQTRETVK